LTVQRLDATRIISAERRGSSWPVLVETDAGRRFTKLRGAAQGTGPLVAEIVVARLAEALELRVPARSLVRLPPDVVSDDPHQELADLLRASEGVNLGFEYLDGARDLLPGEIDSLTPHEAAAIVWLDGLVMNPDRTARNTNLMSWHGDVYLIDHGACLGFQYAWSSVTEESPMQSTPTTEPHLLRGRVNDLEEWDEIFASHITRETIEAAVAEVPDSFLEPLLPPDDAAPLVEQVRRRRAAYVAFLWKRLKAPRAFIAPPVIAARPPRKRPEWLR
jgi:hypothetical protein